MIVSHQAQTLEQFATQAAVLRDGQFIQFDTLEEARQVYDFETQSEKFRVPRSDVLQAVDASLGVTEGNPKLEKAVAPAPEALVPKLSNLDEEVAQPLQAPTGSTNIEDIRKEGLTGRQWRMARRTAQRHDLPAKSNFDAVRLLRQAGIDPFQRSNLLELAPKSDGGPQPAKVKTGQASRPQLPKRHGASNNLPALIPEEDPALRRAREVERIQQSIIKRRQKKLAFPGLRLAFLLACDLISMHAQTIRLDS